MNAFSLLIKTNFKSMFFGKASTIYKKIVLILVMIISIGAVSGIYSYLIAQGCKPFGNFDAVYTFGVYGSVLFVLLSILPTTFSAIAKAKDIDFLLSAPISRRVVVATKILSVLLVAYAFEFFMLIPAGIVYFIYAGFSATKFIYFILGFITLPLFPFLLSSIIAVIGGYILPHIRHRNLFTILFSFIIFGAVFSISFFKGPTGIFGGASSAALLNPLWAAPSIRFLTTAVLYNSGLDILWCILISAVSFIIGFLLLSKNFMRIVSCGVLSGTEKRKHNHKTYHKSGLIQKEFMRLFTTPIYIVQCAMGLIMTLVFAIWISADKTFIKLFSMAPDLFVPIFILVLGFTTALSNTSAITLSLEKKCIYTIKSLPIKAQKLFMAKITYNILLDLPFIVLANIIVSCVYKLGALRIITLFGFSLLFLIFVSILGFAIGLKMAKFNEESDTKIVKQSPALIIVMFIPMILLAALAVLYAYVFYKWLNALEFIAVAAALLVVASVPLCVYIFKGADKKLLEMG